jgi:rod shape-determining protein MreC
MSIELRTRTRVLLACAAVLAGFLAPARHTDALSARFVALFAVPQKFMARGGRFLAFCLDDLATWQGLRAENRRLRDRVARLRAKLERSEARRAATERRLRMLEEFARRRDGVRGREATVAGEVMGEGAGAQRRLVFIDLGSRDGLRPGTTVAAGHSVVGRVRAVAPGTSSALLVTSLGCAFDAEITRTGERGIVLGNGDGTMRMRDIWKARPKAGDAVVTRGLDGITPRHYLLGVIVKAERPAGQLAYDITLRPVQDLGRLVNVVAVYPAVPASEFPPQEGGGPGE